MKSQSDIAQENQEGIEKTNQRQAHEPRRTEDDRASRFDGSAEQKDAGGILKPKDDTPWRIEKRGPPDK